MSDAQQLRELELLPRMLRSSTAASRTAASSTPGSSAPASGIVLAGNAWGTGTPDQPLRDELLAKHVSAAQSWKGQRDYGLKAKCDTLSEFVENSAFADRAPLTMTAKPVDMCRRRAGERRKRDRSCDEVHPGFCKNLDKDILGKAKRLHRSLFNTISSHSAPLGTSLYVLSGVGVDSELLMPCFKLSNPKRLLVAVVDSDVARPFSALLSLPRPFGTRLQTPLVFKDLWHYTRRRIDQPNVDSWKLCRLEYESKVDCQQYIYIYIYIYIYVNASSLYFLTTKGGLPQVVHCAKRCGALGSLRAAPVEG